MINLKYLKDQGSMLNLYLFMQKSEPFKFEGCSKHIKLSVLL